jgi:hypothetical protein
LLDTESFCAPGDFSSFILKGVATQATRGLVNLGWDGLPHFLRYKDGQRAKPVPIVLIMGTQGFTFNCASLFTRVLGAVVRLGHQMDIDTAGASIVKYFGKFIATIAVKVSH